MPASSFRLTLSLAATALCLAACGGGGGDGDPAPAVAAGDYATKTAYQPRQPLGSYEPPPAGFAKVYTELVARHGSRGLSAMKYDDAVLNLWTRAQADGALTPLGRQMGADVERIMRANFLLGWGVAGIGTPGYGNLTQVGIAEHRGLAARLAQRDPELFAGDTFQGRPRQVQVMHSGQDRAVDSAQFFAASLAENAPAMAAAALPPAVVDRYQLYFHKLSAATDAVADGNATHTAVLAASQAYQRYAAATDAAGFGAEAAAKVAAARATPEARAAARAVLERLFTPAFVDKVEAGTYTFSNNSTRTYTSADGRFTNTLKGDGKTRIQGTVDAAALIYELYIIAPALRAEAGVDFDAYMPLAQAHVFAYLQDIDDFYGKGPAATEYAGVTTAIADGLLQDFFGEAERIAQGQLDRVARLRFSHAEVLIPFIARLGLAAGSTPVPRAQTFTYANNPWRGATVSPMATNVQWDVVRNGAGTVLVKMLFDEQEADFPAACDGARYAGSAHYYELRGLEACYRL